MRMRHPSPPLQLLLLCHSICELLLLSRARLLSLDFSRSEKHKSQTFEKNVKLLCDSFIPENHAQVRTRGQCK